jgi:uncharacterized protein (TIGR02611 family)
VEQRTDLRPRDPGVEDDVRPADADRETRRQQWLRRWEERHRHDRWGWRRRLRTDPRAYRIYRIVVGVVGTLLVLLGASTGWLPGPGGIPLTLLGLAVLASEFFWAHRLLGWARERAHEFAGWTRTLPRWARVLGAAATFVGVASVIVLGLLVGFGVPAWVPDDVTAWLVRLPGVD